MPVQVTYPGVYIQEVSSGVRTITGVATSIAMFVGRTERGILKKPTLLLNNSDYERKFGAGATQSELAHQVRQFFLNGGRQAYVTRVANGAEAKEASVELRNEVGVTVLEVTAKEAGTEGARIRIEVDYDTPEPDKTFNLRVFRHVETSSGGLVEESQELFTNLTMDPAKARFAPALVTQESSLIKLAEPSPPLPNTQVVPPVPGVSIAGLVLPKDPNDMLDNIINTQHKNLLKLSVDGTSFKEVDLAGKQSVSGIQDSLNDKFGSTVVTVNLVTVGSDAADAAERALLRFTNKSAQDITFAPASNAAADFGAALQLGVGQGGIDIGAHAKRRPMTSGLSSSYGDNFEHIGAFATAAQNGVKTVTVGSTLIDEIDLVTTGGSDLMAIGKAIPGSESLVNAREKLLRLAQQFNDKARATRIFDKARVARAFDWSMEVQGHRIVLKRIAGDANSGIGVPVATAPEPLAGIEVDNARYYSLGTSGRGGFQASGVDGEDGTSPRLQDYLDAFDIIDREVDLFNLLLLPRDAEEKDEVRATEGFWGAASIFAQQRRAFLLVDPPKGWETVDDVTGGSPVNIGTLRQGLVKDYAAIYWPRLTIVDPTTGININIDPCGAIAGLAARTDANRGVWKAPAGLEADIRGVRGVEQAMSNPENGIINPLAVNAIRVFPNGIVSWGARTMDGFDNSPNSDYRYVPIRRLALLIEETLYRGLQFAVFEPNDEPLWAQIRLAAGSFMNNLFRQGAFQGQRARDAYFVKVDAETTTQNDINLGIVNVVVGFAPLKPAEFVIVTIQQMAGQIQV